MNKQIKDRKNELHGLWKVKEFDCIKNTNAYWWCECQGCGLIKSVMGGTLGKISSGCKKCRTAKANKAGGYKHGESESPEWNSWSKMIVRCTNINHDKYQYYGARGIKVCDRWLDKEKGFINFLEDMGVKPKGYQIDRIDNNGNYEPSNCRWVSRKENCRNKSTNAVYSHQGKTQTMIEWAEEYNLHYQSLAYYLREKKVDISEALVCARKANTPYRN